MKETSSTMHFLYSGFVFAKRLFYIYSGLLVFSALPLTDMWPTIDYFFTALLLISYMMIAIVITKYFLWVDDDFVFLKGTRIESFLEIMEAVPELDIVRKWFSCL